jgi:hypothetical protein
MVELRGTFPKSRLPGVTASRREPGEAGDAFMTKLAHPERIEDASSVTKKRENHLQSLPVLAGDELPEITSSVVVTETTSIGCVI